MGRLFHLWQPAKNTFSPFLDLKRRLDKLSDEWERSWESRKKKSVSKQSVIGQL